MSYSVTEIKPAPTNVGDIEKEINEATSDGSKLVCIEMDNENKRLLIITED